MRNNFNNGGRGIGRRGQGMGISTCVCPECGFKVSHERGFPAVQCFVLNVTLR
ncbi:MAG: hypothetical protein JJE45_00910 [Prolixibacteraceae bacterium]|nr:hypothetical protein [Prolixibacteraceae bacterium]